MYRDETTDARTTGNVVVVSNLNVDGWTPWGSGSGEMWGTASLEVAPGEVWEGTFAGKREITPDGPYSSMRVELHGTGGAIQRLKAQYRLVFPPPGTPIVDGIITGRIVEPGTK